MINVKKMNRNSFFYLLSFIVFTKTIKIDRVIEKAMLSLSFSINFIITILCNVIIKIDNKINLYIINDQKKKKWRTSY